MHGTGLEQEVTTLLSVMNGRGGYLMSLVCTDQGLLVASVGDAVSTEEVAGFTCLFDDIVLRAQRDLAARRVDEVTLLDPGRGRLIVRPLSTAGDTRFFLVVQAPTQASWRRNTNETCREIAALLDPLSASTR